MKGKSTKEVLFEEASRLFMKKGYPATSIRELAVVVGIEPSSIYSHIKSKEDLLIKICLEAAHYFSEGMNAIAGSASSIGDKIEQLIDLHIDSVIELPTSITVFNDEWKHLPEPSMSEFLNIRKKYQSQWLAILSKGIEDRVLQDVDVTVLRDMILSSLRWIHYKNADNKEIDLNKIRNDIKVILAQGYFRR